MLATGFCAIHAWANSSVPVTKKGGKLQTGSICSIPSGTCVDSLMPLPSVPAIVSDASGCLGSSGSGTPSPETASVLGNALQGTGLSMGSISSAVSHFAERCVGGLVTCAITVGDTLEVSPSMQAPYPSRPFHPGYRGAWDGQGQQVGCCLKHLWHQRQHKV